MKRIGIFSGVFDPVHAGHISFALTAIERAKLDKVYLLVETKPRHKRGVSHMGHRVAMARLATGHYPKLGVLELPDQQFSVSKTLPRLKQRFANDELVLMIGSDVLMHMPEWPHVDQLLSQVELVVARRQNISTQEIRQLVQNLPLQTQKLHTILAPSPTVSSELIRAAVGRGKITDLLPSIRAYVADNWLYVSPSASSSRSSS